MSVISTGSYRCTGAGQGDETTNHRSTAAFQILTFAANGGFHFLRSAGLGTECEFHLWIAATQPQWVSVDRVVIERLQT
jgi:hypothetical protein